MLADRAVAKHTAALKRAVGTEGARKDRAGGRSTIDEHLRVAGLQQLRNGRLGRHAGVDAVLLDRRDKAVVRADRQQRVLRRRHAGALREVLLTQRLALLQ